MRLLQYVDIFGSDIFQYRKCVMSTYLVVVNFSVSCMCYVNIFGSSEFFSLVLCRHGWYLQNFC